MAVCSTRAAPRVICPEPSAARTCGIRSSRRVRTTSPRGRSRSRRATQLLVDVAPSRSCRARRSMSASRSKPASRRSRPASSTARASASACAPGCAPSSCARSSRTAACSRATTGETGTTSETSPRPALLPSPVTPGVAQRTGSSRRSGSRSSSHSDGSGASQNNGRDDQAPTASIVMSTSPSMTLSNTRTSVGRLPAHMMRGQPLSQRRARERQEGASWPAQEAAVAWPGPPGPAVPRPAQPRRAPPSPAQALLADGRRAEPWTSSGRPR